MKKSMCREIDLMEHVPFFMKEVQEFKSIVTAENPEFDILQDVRIDMMNNQFIKDSTDYGVSRWESILNIIHGEDDSLEDRKNKILTLINNSIPYTMRSLKKVLANVCGKGNFLVQYNNETFILTIKVISDLENKVTDIQDLLNEIVPANLVINLVLEDVI